MVNYHKLLTLNGWEKVYLRSDNGTVWVHPDFQNIHAVIPADNTDIQYFCEYLIESSQFEALPKKLEIPDYLIGRVSISNDNRFEGMTYTEVWGEEPGPNDPPAFYFTKYYTNYSLLDEEDKRCTASPSEEEEEEDWDPFDVFSALKP